jgi:hypothetical protein
MSPKELRACRERAEAATAGPWRVGSVETYHVFVPCSTCIGPERVLLRFNEHFPHGADAAFIAKARTDVPRLLATIAALQARTEKAEGQARQYERDWHDAKSEFGGAIQERDEQIARLKDTLVANAASVRAATHARDSAACELDDIATTREMACATRIFGHDHPEFHDLSHAEWVTELMNAYEKEVRK